MKVWGKNNGWVPHMVLQATPIGKTADIEYR